MDISEAIKTLNEVRKEDDLYFQGAFWIKGESLSDILDGNFSLIIGSKILTDYYGDAQQTLDSKRSLTHQKLWDAVGDGKSWNYYPRGRVCIDQGTAYIHLNSKCNNEKISSEIEKVYNISNLRIVYDFNNEYQGSHYDFELK